MMRPKSDHTRRMCVFCLVMLLILLSACNFSSLLATFQKTDAEKIQTWAAETLEARRTSTFTLEAGLATAQASQSLTLSATPGPAASLPVIEAIENTNCRTGPHISYERVGFLLVGNSSTVYGRNEAQTWWYIANPTRAGEFCWVWGETTRVAGDLASIPLITPSLEARASFRATFFGLRRCAGQLYILFLVRNTGDEDFYQARIALRIARNDRLVSNQTLDYPYLANEADCPFGVKRLEAGEAALIAIEKTAEIPYNKPLMASLSLCTEPGAARLCVERKVEITLEEVRPPPLGTYQP